MKKGESRRPGARHRLDEILARIECGIWEHDFATGIVTFDERAREILGLERLSLPAADLRHVIDPRDREEVEARIGEALAERRKQLNVVCRLRDREPASRLKIDSFIEYDAEGPVCACGQIQDVLQFERSRVALDSSKMWRFPALVEQIGARFAVFSLDVDTRRVRQLSAGFEAIFGMPVAMVLGHRYDRVIDWLPRSRELASEAIESVASGKADFIQDELGFRHPDGHLRYIRFTSFANREGGSPELDGFVEDVTEKKLTDERLRRAATRDALTGILNHGCFLERLEGDVQLARRHGLDLALIMLDIDHFKQINDEHGHQAGDAALRIVAKELASRFRSSDYCGRYGGDEFILVLRQTPVGDALELAERLRRTVAELAVPCECGIFSVTLSVGVSTCADGARSVDELVQQADVALYAAKAAGRDRVVRYEVGDLAAQDQDYKDR